MSEDTEMLPPVSGRKVKSLPKREVISAASLKLDRVEFVRVQWLDLTNHVRYRVLPTAYFMKLVNSERPGITLTKATMGLVFINLAEGFGAIGEDHYAFDLSTIKPCPYAPGHASVMGWFQEKAMIRSYIGMRPLEVDLCPRTILRRVIENAKDACGVEFLVGVETEFILLKNTSPVEPVNSHGWSMAFATATGNTETVVLEEIARAVEQSGIELQMYHAEAAPGQYEVITGPLPPMQAADALVHTREIIFNIASKHGLRATLAPRLFSYNCGSAAHTHISLRKIEEAASVARSADHANLNVLEASFLAGVLEHLPSIALLALPTAASYDRVKDGIWSGGTYVSWGTDNREAPIRLCNAANPASRNFELKAVDGTSNPYLMLAGVLGAGCQGIMEEMQLKIKDCSGALSAAQLSEQERVEMGIKNRLPLTWEEATKNFENSEFVNNLFGETFRDKYVSVNKLLKEKYTSGLDQEAALRLLIENY